MNKTEIGSNAGIIWRLMNNNSSWTLDELKEKSGLSPEQVWSALGWLAREDKVEFDSNSNEKKVYLNFNPYF